MFPQRGLGEYRQADAEGQLARVGLGVGEVGVVAGQGGLQAFVVWRGVHLAGGGTGVLDLLEVDDVGVVADDLGDGVLDADGGVVRVTVVPDLAELHVELQDAKRFHAVEKRRWRGGVKRSGGGKGGTRSERGGAGGQVNAPRRRSGPR